MKSRNYLLIFFISLQLPSLNYAGGFELLKPKTKPKPMTTSVIIPCVARHFFWLSGILESYQNQTVRPDEVVVSLSEVEKLNQSEISKLENGLWDFKLKIIRNRGIIHDGENRTIAMDNSLGEILIFSDADDIPHPQRVEVAKYIFENFEVDHILHSFGRSRENIKLFNLNELNILKFNTFNEMITFAKQSKMKTTIGSPCFLRKIANKLKWHADHDYEYAHRVYQLFQNNIVLPIPLILYRVHLSSHIN